MVPTPLRRGQLGFLLGWLRRCARELFWRVVEGLRLALERLAEALADFQRARRPAVGVVHVRLQADTGPLQAELGTLRRSLAATGLSGTAPAATQRAAAYEAAMQRLWTVTGWQAAQLELVLDNFHARWRDLYVDRLLAAEGLYRWVVQYGAGAALETYGACAG